MKPRTWLMLVFLTVLATWQPAEAFPPWWTPTGGGSGSATPSGPAGGDLSGTYPNPVVDQSSNGTFTVFGVGPVFEASLQPWTGGGNNEALYLGKSLVPANTNYALLSDGATTYMNGNTALAFQSGGSTIATMQAVGGGSPGLVPGLAATYPNGSNAATWHGVYADTSGFRVYHATNDANPTTQVGDQAVTFGGGGASAIDTQLSRQSTASYLQLDNGLNGDADFQLGGSGGHGFYHWYTNRTALPSGSSVNSERWENGLATGTAPTMLFPTSSGGITFTMTANTTLEVHAHWSVVDTTNRTTQAGVGETSCICTYTGSGNTVCSFIVPAQATLGNSTWCSGATKPSMTCVGGEGTGSGVNLIGQCGAGTTDVWRASVQYISY